MNTRMVPTRTTTPISVTRGDQTHLDHAISLVVSRGLVKSVKSALEERGKYDKQQKIRPAPQTKRSAEQQSAFIIPTKLRLAPFEARCCQAGTKTAMAELLQDLDLAPYGSDVKLAASSKEPKPNGCAFSPENTGLNAVSDQALSKTKNKLTRTIEEWVLTLPEEMVSLIGAKSWEDLGLTIGTKFNYMIYQPMLLLPSNFFSAWPKEFRTTAFPQHAPYLYSLLCEMFHVTHIALNGPISPTVQTNESTTSSPKRDTRPPNILRSPTSLTPLYGSFGPLLPLSNCPTISDFNEAFWCTARQNSILQTWAPRYTMFSRGNISEKTRLLRLPSLTEDNLGCPTETTSAVDLYAGIGYFAFSYVRAGVGKMLCWEINPWSVEGLRRGASGNGWAVKTFGGADSVERYVMGNERLVVFEESNEHAVKRINAIRAGVPPVRHVNCGFLPSSRESWRTAVEVLDPVRGGWVHAHENIGKKDIEGRAEEIVFIFYDLVNAIYRTTPGIEWEVSCEHVEQVKSYAPGVMHCVLDIAIAPTETLP